MQIQLANSFSADLEMKWRMIWKYEGGQMQVNNIKCDHYYEWCCSHKRGSERNSQHVYQMVVECINYVSWEPFAVNLLYCFRKKKTHFFFVFSRNTAMFFLIYGSRNIRFTLGRFSGFWCSMVRISVSKSELYWRGIGGIWRR